MKKRNILIAILNISMIAGCKSKENNPLPVNPVNPVIPVNPIIPIDPVDPTDPIIEESWNTQEKLIFAEHLYGFELPFRENSTLSWNANDECICLESGSITIDEFNEYVNSIVELGFSKQNGPYPNTYILLNEIDYQEGMRTIDIDIYISGDVMYAYCYDPFIYEWPENTIKNLFENYFYRKPSTIIPTVNAKKYYVDASTVELYGILAINCYTDINIENDFIQALRNNLFNIGIERDSDGYFTAVDKEEIVEIKFGYKVDDECLYILIEEFDGGWPAFIVDYYTDQLTNGSGTRIPAVIGADSYEFIENAWDSHGYFFVLCEMNENIESQYAAILDETYTVYNERVNTAGNYWAVSDNEDLLVQYKYVYVESIMGGDPYIHFDILFEPFYPYNNEQILRGLQRIRKGTETTIPQYPGLGEKITFSDNNVYMNIMIQTATSNSLNEYMLILKEQGWSTYEISSYLYSYEAVSPNKDIKLTTSILDGRIQLTFSSLI